MNARAEVPLNLFPIDPFVDDEISIEGRRHGRNDAVKAPVHYNGLPPISGPPFKLEFGAV